MTKKDKNPTAEMPETEFSELIAFLEAHGAKNKDLKDALGSKADKRTRNQVAAELRRYLRELPKGN